MATFGARASPRQRLGRASRSYTNSVSASTPGVETVTSQRCSSRLDGTQPPLTQCFVEKGTGLAVDKTTRVFENAEVSHQGRADCMAQE